MSKFNKTRPVQVNTIDAIVERLNGSVAMVSKLRLSIDELETELSQIRQQCENMIHTHVSIASVRDAPITRRRRAHRVEIPPTPHPPEMKPDQLKIAMTRGQIEEPEEQQGERRPKRPRLESKRDAKPPVRKVAGRSTKNQRKGSPSGIPLVLSSHISAVPKLPAGIGIAIETAGGNLSGWCPQSRTAVRPVAEQIRASHPPRPPTNLFPFPEHINLSPYPPELKHEGDGWVVLFNSSPKVKRVLNVDLVHDLGNRVWPGCIRFSRDGKWFAAEGLSAAKIYDVKTGVVSCGFNHALGVFIWSVCFSPDGKYLATGGGKQIRIWNIAEQQIHSTFEGHQDSINSLDFSPNGQFLVSGSDDGSVRIWDVCGGASKVLTIDDHYHKHHKVYSVAISPDGRCVAVGSQDTVVSIWELPTGVLLQRLRGHAYGVSSVAFTPDGKGLISGSNDNTLKCWDVGGLDICSGSGTALMSTSSTSPSPCLMNLTGHTDRVNSIAISHDGHWVVSGANDGKVLFWDMRTSVVQYIIMLPTDERLVCQVDLSPTGSVFATAGSSGRIRIWSYEVPGPN